MNVFIIGIPQNYRGAHLESQLESQKINYSRSDGVIVSQLNDFESSRLVDKSASKYLARRTLTPGEIGCALAHQVVYKKALEQNLPYILVLEDDAELQVMEIPDFSKFLNVEKPIVVMACFDPGTTWVGKTSLENRLFRAVVPPTLTTAYWVNRSAMRELIDAATPLTFVADWPVKCFSTVEFYVPGHPIFIPATGNESTISGRPQEGGKGTTQRTIKRALRFISVISHYRWIKNASLYGKYQNYVIHEMLRFPVFTILRNKCGNENFGFPLIHSRLAALAIRLLKI